MLEYISWHKGSQSDRTHPALLLLTTRSTTINYMETEQDCVIVVPNIKLELLGNSIVKWEHFITLTGVSDHSFGTIWRLSTHPSAEPRDQPQWAATTWRAQKSFPVSSHPPTDCLLQVETKWYIGLNIHCTFIELWIYTLLF